ncbi:ERC protein 2-like [Mastomys coucha]|uniref:ERC protein 2-like n=1 Tax=Mastomys coucha TaxID=35658 RepID=UPI0012622523|nr:ERC protein 2-like [Mastomys coucha]XP_031245162.1 ERC protein 2-like [Mastomys coucha]XP_031245163.1 ERC protein 2-like [Mastomys coucha]XP_031245164.1 ERC protein 2-like [Mastomys coucha]XP_031245165.1 ERC protein 2-like [Mastomys coucha]XP_031245166.1 ERC protein 2-like [Mastomys coucha]XP_031245167.1 ERC protein 2-like [Mastomys coucha]XP_031245168.1 ERC protein 2-like [Mastomys coucha]XP_031245169.1 ERC protein 2-like [Mastomys coucha]XP_031245170.1 ERC protein 2-like [Mastomys cou
MSVEKELPFMFSHPSRKVRSKPLREPRGRNKARIPGAQRKPRRNQRRSPPESHCKKAQVQEKEKVWVPWNGLIVIGKRVELLDRNVQKSNPKLESEYWKLEGTGKKFSKEKSGLQQETIAKLLSSVGRTVHARAGLENDNPETWRELEDRFKAGLSKSAEMTAEREENLKSRDKLRATGGDLRSRGDQLRQNEELESNGENLMSKREKRVSIGEKVVGRGEKRRSADEKMDSRERRGSVREKALESGEKRGSIRDKMSDTRERRESIRDKMSDTRERQGSIREKVSDSGERRGSVRDKNSDTRERRGSIKEKVLESGEKRGSIREKASDSGEKRGSIREKVSDSRERRGSIREKVSDSGERRGSIREKAKLGREKFRSSGEKLKTGDKNSRSTEDILESNTEELESAEVKLEEHSRIGSPIEETIERVINITGGESVLENMSQEMQIPSESVEGIDEHEGAEKGVEIDSQVLDGVRDTADQSAPEEEKDTLGESTQESGG